MASVMAAQTPRFERDVQPIFALNCFACHGGTAMIGLDLRTAASTLAGSHEGPVVVPGSAEKSLLYQKVSGRTMPPPAFNLSLTDAQIESIKKWIEAGAPSDEAEVTAAKLQTEAARFEKAILPIFRSRCFSCHATSQPMAGLDLRTVESVLRGGASGPVLSNHGAEKSILFRRVANHSMPPAGSAEPLTDTEVQQLRRWIDGLTVSPRAVGARERETFAAAEAPEVTEKDRAYWAFRKPGAAAVPAVKDKNRVRTPIDAFALAKLESKGLTLSADVDPLTLMRRAYFDLIGLPPSPEEVEAFLADRRPGAYERLLDRLLESDQYGERWGRHWLDAAGYTEVQMFDNNVGSTEIFEGIWKYRDYVVKAFNQDKPYDRFLTEQLAGDEMSDWRNAKQYTPEMLELLIATGYLRSVYDRTNQDVVNLPGERYDVLFHLMEKISTGILGLTMGCARCHSHKYDPIPQRDYYRLMAFFTPGYNPVNWKQPKHRYLHSVSKAEEEEIARHNAEIDRPLKELKERLAGLRRPHEGKLLETRLQALPEAIRAETREALATAAEKRDPVQKFLASKFEKALAVTAEEVTKALSDPDRAAAAKLEQQIALLNGYRRSFEKIQALWDLGPPPKMRFLRRGDVESPGPRVEPGFLTVLSEPGKTDVLRPPETQGNTSSYRLALARWLTSRNHPLTARVMVNRVWQHHFGRGIVETPENFGRSGSPPTHPELLDWLAVNFMDNGWTLKRLHKLIMTSTVFRQSSRQQGAGGSPEALKLDPQNRLLWRMNLRRLEAEVIRDAMLAASGKLDRTMGGPPAFGPAMSDGLTKLVDGFNKQQEIKAEGTWRRSLYLFARRNFPLAFLEAFDGPVMQVNCTRRMNSVSPMQSLTALNDDFAVESGRHLAERAQKMLEAGRGVGPVEAAFLLALSRRPRAEERDLAATHLQKQEALYLKANTAAAKARQMALASFAQMLMASNEFLYVE
jgi:mono/diheme cytochrome c family protein